MGIDCLIASRMIGDSSVLRGAAFEIGKESEKRGVGEEIDSEREIEGKA